MTVTRKPWVSSAEKWVPCPASVALESQYPESRGGGERYEGIAAHQYLESVLAGTPFDLGHMTKVGVPVNAEMVAGAMEVVSALCDVGVDPWRCEVEARVETPQLGPDLQARIDVAFVDHAAQTLYVLDYKYGHRYVPAVDSWQLALSAAALAERDGLSADWCAVLLVVQPRCFVEATKVRDWVTTVGNCAHLMTVAARSAALAGQPQAPLRTGPHCYSCSARRACGAFASVVGVATDDAWGVSPRELTGRELAAEIVLLREAGDRIKSRLTALEAQAMGDLQRGQAVPGWTVGYSKPHLQWTISHSEVLMLGDGLGIDLRAPKQAVSPSQALKLGIAASVVESYSSRPPGAPRLERVKPPTPTPKG